MKIWILFFCLLFVSCSNRQTQSSDHEDFYRIDFRPLVKNEALEVGFTCWWSIRTSCHFLTRRGNIGMISEIMEMGKENIKECLVLFCEMTHCLS